MSRAYYALRQTGGPAQWKALKLQAIALNTSLRQKCRIPQAGAPDQTMPPGVEQCYIDETEKQRQTWISDLSGSSREEAARDIEQHIALQKRLVDLGFLPTGTSADGVYGSTTRAAIKTWQRVTHRPNADGFISDADAKVLASAGSADVAPITNEFGRGEEQPGIDALSVHFAGVPTPTK